MIQPQYEHQLDDETQMCALGAKLAKLLHPGLVIFLEGDLGAGKTTFTRSMLRALGVDGPVKSPTYALLESYHLADVDSFHFDLYRLADAEELEYLDVRDYLTEQSICVFEWPERGQKLLPSADITCYIGIDGAARHVRFFAASGPGRKILSML